jgi:hypothetical protein
MGHPNTKKHKAKSRGYKSKPTGKAVSALLDLYAGIAELPEVITPTKAEPGVQLKLF